MSGAADRVGQAGRRRRVRVGASVALLVLAGCSSGWSDSQKDEVRNVCIAGGGDAPECECTVEAVMSAFPDPDDFRRSQGPSAELVNALADCGVLGA